VKYLFVEDWLKKPLISTNDCNKSIIPTRTEPCPLRRVLIPVSLDLGPGSLEWLITSQVMNVETLAQNQQIVRHIFRQIEGEKGEWKAFKSAALASLSAIFHPNSFAFIFKYAFYIYPGIPWYI